MLEIFKGRLSLSQFWSSVKAVLQDIASFEETQETLALLKILALRNQAIAAGKVKPAADVDARLRAKRSSA